MRELRGDGREGSVLPCRRQPGDHVLWVPAQNSSIRHHGSKMVILTLSFAGEDNQVFEKYSTSPRVTKCAFLT